MGMAPQVYRAEKAPFPRPARMLVRRAAVLGAGVMGSQIAGLLASYGIPCDLLDLPSEAAPPDSRNRNRLAEDAKRRLLGMKPSPLFSLEALGLVHPGNFDDDLGRLKEADWVIEAVSEKLEVKHNLWKRVASHIRRDAIISSNTSGIPIELLAEALPSDLRSRFLGTHFFNPPRYLRLLEVVPGPDTDPDVTEAVRRFAEDVLGKGVVYAKDVPNFVANRMGCYGLMVTLQAMEEFGLAVDEVDSITGPVMGRPKSATFRTLDMAGLDVFVDVCENVRRRAQEAWEKDAFEVPGYIKDMVAQNWLGEKAGQGFYKRTGAGDDADVLVLDPAKMEYRPRRYLQSPTLVVTRNIEDVRERLRVLMKADDVAGRFSWRVLSRLLAYAASKVGEVSDDVASIDMAMRWGFGWELGPFETWDALGVQPVVRRMQAEKQQLPEWVVQLAERGGSFYRHEVAYSLQATPSRGYVPLAEGEKTLSLQRLRATRVPLVARAGASLYDLGDGVAFLDFHSPKQAIGPDMIQMLGESARRVPEDFRGLVVSSHVMPNFCVGANLWLILLAAQDGQWDELDTMIRNLQYGLLRLKRLPVPVVVAPYGLALGGGAEVVFAGHRVVAAAETYMGLVEVGAGVIPAGGGCKELLIRSLEGLPGGLAALASREKGGPPQLVPDVDPVPAVARVFETIGTAKVAGSAFEARTLGFIRSADVVVPNLDHLLYVAKHTVLAMDMQGRVPTPTVKAPVLGSGVRALLELAAQHMVWGGIATDHDLKIARKLAYVLTGGDRPAGAMMDEEYFLELEREAFLSLCGEPKTQARMQYVLEKGKPLRN